MTLLQPISGSACGCDIGARDQVLVRVDQALDRIAACVSPLNGRERVSLATAKGRVLAAPIHAMSDMPRFDHAAMDGYAVRLADLIGPGPWHLPVALRAAAGDGATARLPEGVAARIFTGAPIPEGADCVIMQEHVDATSGAIHLKHRPRPGEHIRFRGEEHKRDAEVLASGHHLTARAIAAAAASGLGEVCVVRKTRVALLVSGSEIAAPGTTGLEPAHIWDVNTPMLQACLSRAGVDLVAVRTMPDDRDGIAAALDHAARRSDLVVTTGGVSVGEEDHLHSAVISLCGETVFAGVALKPGKPVAFGRLGQSFWLGLPGNPQSAYVTWVLFGEAILRHLSGRSDPHLKRRPVVLSHPVSRKPGRCEIRSATRVGCDGKGREIVACPDPVRSGQVGALSAAEGFVFLPAEADQLPQGALVEFLPLGCQ